ncbi:MAG: TIR domain-containing protein, partial [Proteobacteria bacterium]|nr:TIR domain-containing protein [Pseudomonadota bacterium]
MNKPHTYFAFISYSRKDSKAAKWLQRRLEWFRFPVKMVAEEFRPGHPKYIRPVYRDKTNLEVDHAHYWENIKKAISQSRFLIVLCSPDSASSQPVDKEIRYFFADPKRKDALADIVPVILKGNVGNQDDSECLCPALLEQGSKIMDRNLPTMVPDGDDSEKDGWENGFIGVASYLLQLKRESLSDHCQREERKRARRAKLFSAVFALLAILAIAGGIIAWRQSNRLETEKQNTEKLLKESEHNFSLALLSMGETQSQSKNFNAAHFLAIEAVQGLKPDAYGELNTARSLLANCPSYPIAFQSPINQHHKNYVDSVEFTADGKIMASGSGSGTVILWETATGKRLDFISTDSLPVEGLSFSPDGKSLAVALKGTKVFLWDLETRQKTLTWQVDAPWVNCVRFSPDGKSLAISYNDHIHIWDSTTGELRSRLEGQKKGSKLLLWSPKEKWMVAEGHKDDVTGISFSPDGKTLASSSNDGSIIFWDLNTDTIQQRVITEEGVGINSVAFSPDGTEIAFGIENGDVFLWNVIEEKTTVTFQEHSDLVTDLTFSPNGKKLASGSRDESVILWDLESHEPLHILKGHSAMVNTVRFSPDGKMLVSGGSEGMIMAWNSETGVPYSHFTGHTNSINTIAFSPGGRMLASGSADKSIFLWDLSTGEVRMTLKGHTESVRGLKFSPEGDLLASTSPDSTIRIWDMKTGDLSMTLDGMESFSNNISFSANGKILASGSDDGTIELWDLTRKTYLSTIDLQVGNGTVYSLAFSPANDILAASVGNGNIVLIDVKSWDVIS